MNFREWSISSLVMSSSQQPPATHPFPTFSTSKFWCISPYITFRQTPRSNPHMARDKNMTYCVITIHPGIPYKPLYIAIICHMPSSQIIPIDPRNAAGPSLLGPVVRSDLGCWESAAKSGAKGWNLPSSQLTSTPRSRVEVGRWLLPISQIPCKKWILSWWVDNPSDTKRLKDWSIHPSSKIDLELEDDVSGSILQSKCSETSYMQTIVLAGLCYLTGGCAT